MTGDSPGETRTIKRKRKNYGKNCKISQASGPALNFQALNRFKISRKSYRQRKLYWKLTSMHNISSNIIKRFVSFWRKFIRIRKCNKPWWHIEVKTWAVSYCSSLYDPGLPQRGWRPKQPFVCVPVTLAVPVKWSRFCYLPK